VLEIKAEQVQFLDAAHKEATPETPKAVEGDLPF
jgi:hypothetical protein